VFFTGCTAVCSASATYVFDFAAREARRLVENASTAWYTPTGHMVFARRDGALLAMAFDPVELAATGTPVPLIDVQPTAWGFPEAVLGVDGTLLYVVGASDNLMDVEPVYVDREGEASPVDSGWTVRVQRGIWVDGLALSPDGSQLAITNADETTDLWVKELDHGPLTRLTHAGATNTRPVWMPDGRSIRFISDRSAGRYRVWTKRADGSAPAEEFTGLPDPVWEVINSPVGELVAIRVGTSASNRDLLLVERGPRTTVNLLSGEFHVFSATLSPDGRWLAYVSDESGRYEVYVRPFPDAGTGRWQLSASGGTEPLWAHSGRELFYVNGEGSMVTSSVTPSETFRIDGEAALFPLGKEYRRDRWYRTYDVTPDDQQFVMLRIITPEGESESDLVLVENWFTEVEEILGGE